MYVYLRSEPSLWTVGFYHPDGRWEAESDHQRAEEAAQRVHWLSGGQDVSRLTQAAPALLAACRMAESVVRRLGEDTPRMRRVRSDALLQVLRGAIAKGTGENTPC